MYYLHPSECLDIMFAILTEQMLKGKNISCAIRGHISCPYMTCGCFCNCSLLSHDQLLSCCRMH